MTPSVSPSLVLKSFSPSPQGQDNSISLDGTQPNDGTASFHDFLKSFSHSRFGKAVSLDTPSSFHENKNPTTSSDSHLIQGLSSTDPLTDDSKNKQEEDESSSSMMNPFFGLIQNQQELLSTSTPSSADAESSLELHGLESSASFSTSDPSPSKSEISVSDAPFSIPSSLPLSQVHETLNGSPSTPVLSSPSLSFETHQALMESSVKLFTHMHANQLESTVVQATPAHMGPLQATLQQDSQTQQYQISISVVHADAYQMMKDQVHQLSSALDQLGLDASKIDIHHDPSMQQFISNPVNAPSASSDLSFSSQSQSQSQSSYFSQSPFSSRQYFNEESTQDPLQEKGRISSTASLVGSGGRNFDRYA